MPDAASKSILVIGMSHINAVKAAVINSSQADFEFMRISISKGKKKKQECHPAFDVETGKIVSDRLQTPEPDVVVLCLSGAEHNQLAMFEHPDRFMLVPENGTVQADMEDRQLLPSGLFKDIVKTRRSSVRALINEVVASFPTSQLMVMLPPPPLENGVKLRDLKDATPGMAAVWEYGVASDETRMAAYAISTSVITEEAHDIGATVIEPDAAALTSKGLLREDFCENATHGNAEYGGLMLRKILDAGNLR